MLTARTVAVAAARPARPAALRDDGATMDEPSSDAGDRESLCTSRGDVNDGEALLPRLRASTARRGLLRCERCGTPDDGSRFCRTCGAPGGRLFEGDEPAPVPGYGAARIGIAAAVAAIVLAGGVLLR